MAKIFRAVLAVAMIVGVAAPALAQQEMAQASWPSGYPGAYQNPYQGGYPAAQPYGQPVWQGANGQPSWQGNNSAPSPAEADPRYREMLERCQNVGRRNSGTVGGLIGGVVGGVIGNRVASGNRALGTVAGAAVGAATGAVIGNSADRGRERECEEFFSRYTPAPGHGPQHAGYPYPAYGYPAYGYMMVPVMMVQGQQQQPCTETRTETVTYVREHSHHRYVRPHPVYRVKRVKEKRVYTGD